MSLGKQVFVFEGEDLRLKLRNEVQKVLEIYKKYDLKLQMLEEL